ncbi:MAG: thiamine pyrophosphate-dependent dehydrogenase E1 component subunit alpha [Caldilineales bacterium]|nr:thiamine pyrophosphate-dependent dehydrogenase E1 component subunit alpha [Caldilineales bacterium]MCW5858509.1 thiamine pyrophosphate-dependent dehydrogenase E1 component subunit alpha [Caldilineales bacterium]
MPESHSSLDPLHLYGQMLTIRRFEERCNYLYMQGRIPSTLHLYIGQEAVAVGVCAHLHTDDYVASTHRPHGHAIAKGVALRAIMAELFAKDTGCCRGKGGSMHVGDVNVGMFPAIAIVGGGIPIAAGAALASKRLGNGRVAVSFFGEGASNEGAFHETLNMAAIWQLPVVFVCENNLYAASTPVSWVFKVEDVASRASAYGIPGEIVDGNDVLAVYEAAGRAVERARSGGGPTLLECKTYRLVGHSRSDPRTYRTKEEEADWAGRDPLPRLASHLLASGQATEATLAAIDQEVTAAIDDAVAFAEASPSPRPEDALNHVFFDD